MAKVTKKSKNTRIAEELKRISVWYADIPENELTIISGLLQNSAFMKVTLDDLAAEITASGSVDEYQNGANQSGKKIAAAVQSYNALLKNYLATTKTLAAYLPRMVRASAFPYTYQTQAPALDRFKSEIEEMEEETDKERASRINAEIEAAAEKQKRDREEWAKRKQPINGL